MNERPDLPPTECHIVPGPQPDPELLPIEPIRYVPVATTGTRAPAQASWPWLFDVTDTDVTVHDPAARRLFPEAHQALLDWMTVHDIDPDDVLYGTTITRDEAGRRVLYERVMRDSQGQKLWWGDAIRVVDAVVQGETPPMPWPAAVLALREQP